MGCAGGCQRPVRGGGITRGVRKGSIPSWVSVSPPSPLPAHTPSEQEVAEQPHSEEQPEVLKSSMPIRLPKIGLGRLPTWWLAGRGPLRMSHVTSGLVWPETRQFSSSICPSARDEEEDSILTGGTTLEAMEDRDSGRGGGLVS